MRGGKCSPGTLKRSWPCRRVELEFLVFLTQFGALTQPGEVEPQPQN